MTRTRTGNHHSLTPTWGMNGTTATAGAFERSTRRFAALLRERAAGRTCGTCQDFATSCCRSQVSLDGERLATQASAVACAEWRA